MAVKALIFGTDDLYPQLEPFYVQQVQIGNLEIVGQVVIENNQVKILSNNLIKELDRVNFEIAIISPNVFTLPPNQSNNFYNRMKFLEQQGIPRKNIIDGRVFQVPNFDFPRFLAEGVAHGRIENNKISLDLRTIYKTILKIADKGSILSIGSKSYMGSSLLEGFGSLTVGNFSAISWNEVFELGNTVDHNYKGIFSYALCGLDWNTPPEFFPPTLNKGCKIDIGNDVWVGRGSILKSTNPEKPLTIGDGAVIASDSVVVKDVPPYAIVGGNPAKIIKYRFSDKIIESLLKIKWWDWDIDKIHDNFKYFNRVEEFVEMHDKGV